MEKLHPLLKTSLVVVAHPDDEVIAFGGLAQRMKRPVVVFSTDGAPRDQYFWKDYPSREHYAEVRRQEARRALRICGAEAVFLADAIESGIADQELFRRLPQAVQALDKVVEHIRPDVLLTLAYEGGHPDHDACCFIAAETGKRHRIPVWESPLYHRRADGSSAPQTFPNTTGSEIEVEINGDELENKLKMFHTYESQKLTLEGFRPEVERFRPLGDYDFTRPPLPWKLNYELWQWKMSGEEVAAHFASYLRGFSKQGKGQIG